MNKEWEKVREFQEKFNHPVSNSPKFMEADEIVEQADAMIDVMYFALGTLVEMGIKPDELFDIVHNANMSKLWPDGKPHYNAEGKTIKPSTWVDPHPLLEKCINNMKEAGDIND